MRSNTSTNINESELKGYNWTKVFKKIIPHIKKYIRKQNNRED